MTRDQLIPAAAWTVALALACLGEWPSAIGLALGLILGRLMR